MKTKKRFWIFAATALVIEAALGASIAIASNTLQKTEEVIYHRHATYHAPWDVVVDDGLLIHASSEEEMVKLIDEDDRENVRKSLSEPMHIWTEEEIEAEAEKGVTVITLTEEETDAPYRIFSGDIGVDIVEGTQVPFIAPPTTFECIVGYNKAIMITDDTHASNFKTASVTVTYGDGTVKTGENSGTDDVLPVIAEYHSGRITDAVYTLTMYKGDSESSGIDERAVIHFYAND